MTVSQTNHELGRAREALAEAGCDAALLSSLATSTGGKVGPDAEALRRAGTDSRAARRAMWPGLVLFSLVGWAVDLLLRRVRLFER